MKKIALLALVSTLLINVIANVPHGKEHDFMIISLPRSGSTFLIRALKEALSVKVRCWEKFNRAFMEPKIPEIQINQNGLLYGLVAQTLQEDYLEEYYNSIWTQVAHNITKEVYTIFNIDFFQKKFKIVGLYRHRNCTFPSSQPHYFVGFYEAFEKSTQSSPLLNKTQSFLEPQTLTPLEKQCAAHIIFNYVLLSKCAHYDLPIIEYQRLITLDLDSLHNYLKQQIPSHFFNSSLPQIIQQLREELESDFLDRRTQKYESLNTEPFCKKLISFMKKLDPKMPYWKLLE